MTTPVEIKGGGDGGIALVTKYGAQVIGPSNFDQSKFHAMDAAAIAFNFFPAVAGKQFVITGLNIKAARSVNNSTAAVIVVFEGDSPTDATGTKVLWQDALVQSESSPAFPINVLVNAGKFVNAKTSDPTVNINIVGYYIPEIK